MIPQEVERVCQGVSTCGVRAGSHLTNKSNLLLQALEG